MKYLSWSAISPSKTMLAKALQRAKLRKNSRLLQNKSKGSLSKNCTTREFSSVITISSKQKSLRNFCSEIKMLHKRTTNQNNKTKLWLAAKQ